MVKQESLFGLKENELKEFAICETCGEYCDELFESSDKWNWLCKSCKKEELQLDILEAKLKSINCKEVEEKNGNRKGQV